MKVDKMTPEVYYRESRDFSFIGRVAEVVFNYMKTTSDSMRNLFINEYCNSDLLELLVRTVGFTPRHEYIRKDLLYIANSFVEILRNKGNKVSIATAIQLLLTSQNIEVDVINNINKYIIQNADDKLRYTIQIPYNMTDIILLQDILDYILPAGCIYEFRYIPEELNTITNKIVVKDLNKVQVYTDSDLGQISNANNIEYVSNMSDDITNRSTTYTGTVVSKIKDGE